MADRPTEFIYRGHKIQIAVTQLRSGRWTWWGMIDDQIEVPMGSDDDGARSRSAAVDAALLKARAIIEQQ